MEHTGLKNDRLWQAVNVLATDEGDVRKRVAVACSLLKPIRQGELSPELWERLQRVICEASRRGPMLNHQGDVVRDALENSWRGARNKTYKKYAEEIFSVWKALNGIF